MSGRDVLNADQTGPMQLPMFMRATDLRDSLTGTLDRISESVDTVMEDKLWASKGRAGHGHGTGVYDDVKEHGVLNPVQMVHARHDNLMMGQGHHRVAAAADIAESTGRDMWVPVVHTDAREGTRVPMDIHSEAEVKKGVIYDHRRFMQNTPAIGHDLGWRQKGGY